MESGDVVFVEPAPEVRVIVRIPGRYSLADLRDARGERRVFPCRAVYLSPHEIGLAGPVSGKIGERVIAHVEHLGKLEGPISRLIKGGFMISVTANREKRDELGAKIEWLENFKNHDTPNRRAADRIVPANAYSRLTYADGSIEDCFVRDFSVTGAAISADTSPALKTVLAVGSVIGRVIRHFPGGFAIQFIQRQDPETLEAAVMGK